MDTSEWAAVVSAGIAALAFLLAVFQTVSARQTRKTAEDKIVHLGGVVVSARAQVQAAADASDALVQRAKAGAGTDELANLGRVGRGQLLALSGQLTRELGDRTRWRVGKVLVSSPPPPPPSPPPGSP